MYLVDFKRCCYEKDGKKVEYYRCVLTDVDLDYKVKSMTKECYQALRSSYDEDCEIPVPLRINKVFYDEFGRVCDIEF